MVSMAERPAGEWRPPVVRTVATAASGVDDLVAAVDDHHRHLGPEGLRARRTRRAAREVEGLALEALRHRVRRTGGGETLQALAAEVVAGRTDPYAAADRLLAEPG